MQYAFRALAARALSVAELRTRLLRRAANAEDAESVLARVQELGYLDDAALARQVAGRSGVGRHRVRADLTRRGVDADTTQQALEVRDDDREAQEAAALLERQLPRFLRARDPRGSAFAFLARRGFGSGVIWQVLRQHDFAPPDDGE
ncbi:Regulatory protein recX [Deinococcus maricopensis DSM 21211]|uniref:Regulatory protein RecX n=2 Tax=Deinococcus TaxID=1298 RepID=E8U9B4_DEIML|nr:Regulatory protein recX [Deinococcus maricopensis DSM 21211]